jgi:hypothetical protein
MFNFFKNILLLHLGCISKLRVLYFLPQNSCANRNKELTARERLKEGDWNIRCGCAINEGDAYRVLVEKPEGNHLGNVSVYENTILISSPCKAE